MRTSPVRWIASSAVLAVFSWATSTTTTFIFSHFAVRAAPWDKNKTQDSKKNVAQQLVVPDGLVANLTAHQQSGYANIDDDALPPLEAPKPKRAPEKLGDAYQPEEPPPYAREHVVGEDASTRPSTTISDAADLSLPTTPDAELSLTQILEKQAASQGRVSPGPGVVGFVSSGGSSSANPSLHQQHLLEDHLMRFAPSLGPVPGSARAFSPGEGPATALQPWSEGEEEGSSSSAEAPADTGEMGSASGRGTTEQQHNYGFQVALGHGVYSGSAGAKIPVRTPFAGQDAATASPGTAQAQVEQQTGTRRAQLRGGAGSGSSGGSRSWKPSLRPVSWNNKPSTRVSTPPIREDDDEGDDADSQSSAERDENADQPRSQTQSPNLIDALTQMHYVDQHTDVALEDRVRNVKRSAPWGPSRGDESDTGVARWVRSRLASPSSSGAGEALATSTPPRGSTPPAPNEDTHATAPASSDDEATFAWRVWKANSLAEERLKGIVSRLLVDADSHPPLLSQHEGDAERDLAASDASLRYSSSSAGPESPGDGEDDLLHVPRPVVRRRGDLTQLREAMARGSPERSPPVSRRSVTPAVSPSPSPPPESTSFFCTDDDGAAFSVSGVSGSNEVAASSLLSRGALHPSERTYEDRVALLNALGLEMNVFSKQRLRVLQEQHSRRQGLERAAAVLPTTPEEVQAMKKHMAERYKYLPGDNQAQLEAYWRGRAGASGGGSASALISARREVDSGDAQVEDFLPPSLLQGHQVQADCSGIELTELKKKREQDGGATTQNISKTTSTGPRSRPQPLADEPVMPAVHTRATDSSALDIDVRPHYLRGVPYSWMPEKHRAKALAHSSGGNGKIGGGASCSSLVDLEELTELHTPGGSSKGKLMLTMNIKAGRADLLVASQSRSKRERKGKVISSPGRTPGARDCDVRPRLAQAGPAQAEGAAGATKTKAKAVAQNVVRMTYSEAVRGVPLARPEFPPSEERQDASWLQQMKRNSSQRSDSSGSPPVENPDVTKMKEQGPATPGAVRILQRGQALPEGARMVSQISGRATRSSSFSGCAGVQLVPRGRGVAASGPAAARVIASGVHAGAEVIDAASMWEHKGRGPHKKNPGHDASCAQNPQPLAVQPPFNASACVLATSHRSRDRGMVSVVTEPPASQRALPPWGQTPYNPQLAGFSGAAHTYDQWRENPWHQQYLHEQWLQSDMMSWSYCPNYQFHEPQPPHPARSDATWCVPAPPNPPTHEQPTPQNPDLRYVWCDLQMQNDDHVKTRLRDEHHNMAAGGELCTPIAPGAPIPPRALQWSVPNPSGLHRTFRTAGDAGTPVDASMRFQQQEQPTQEYYNNFYWCGGQGLTSCSPYGYNYPDAAANTVHHQHQTVQDQAAEDRHSLSSERFWEEFNAHAHIYHNSTTGVRGSVVIPDSQNHAPAASLGLTLTATAAPTESSRIFLGTEVEPVSKRTLTAGRVVPEPPPSEPPVLPPDALHRLGDHVALDGEYNPPPILSPGRNAATGGAGTAATSAPDVRSPSLSSTVKTGNHDDGRAHELLAPSISTATALPTSEIRPQRPLLLIGLPGAGKSTLAKKLAVSLGLPLVETDKEILDSVKHRHTSIAAFVEKEGWRAFRAREREVLLRVGTPTLSASMHPQHDTPFSKIVDCGGGIVEHNLDILRNLGWCVWIQRPKESIMKSLEERENFFIKTADDLEAISAKRSPLYEKAADFVFENKFAPSLDGSDLAASFIEAVVLSLEDFPTPNTSRRHAHARGSRQGHGVRQNKKTVQKKPRQFLSSSLSAEGSTLGSRTAAGAPSELHQSAAGTSASGAPLLASKKVPNPPYRKFGAAPAPSPEVSAADTLRQMLGIRVTHPPPGLENTVGVSSLHPRSQFAPAADATASIPAPHASALRSQTGFGARREKTLPSPGIKTASGETPALMILSPQNAKTVADSGNARVLFGREDAGEQCPAASPSAIAQAPWNSGTARGAARSDGRNGTKAAGSGRGRGASRGW